jgi:hypothetical protein
MPNKESRPSRVVQAEAALALEMWVNESNLPRLPFGAGEDTSTVKG